MDAPVSPRDRSIVLLWLGRLGDVLISAPFVAAIKKKSPDSKVVLVTGAAGAGGAELLEGVDSVLVLKNSSHPLSNLKLLLALRAEKPDLLIDMNSAFSRSASVLARLIPARRAAAFRRGKGDGRFSLLAASPQDTEHMSERYRRLGELLGLKLEDSAKLRVCASAKNSIERMLREKLPGDSPLIVMHPGNFKKFDNRWPEEKFAALGKIILQRTPRLALLAGPGETEQASKIAAQVAPSVPVLGPLPAAETAALFERTALFVGNATGSAHLAAAAGTKTLTFLAGYTKTVWMPKEGGPAGPRHFQAVSDSWTSCRDIPLEAAAQILDSALKSLAA